MAAAAGEEAEEAAAATVAGEAACERVTSGGSEPSLRWKASELVESSLRLHDPFASESTGLAGGETERGRLLALVACGCEAGAARRL